MTWLHCEMENTRILHSKLYCVVCQKYKDKICEMKHFLCAWITVSGNQKTSNVIDHVILSFFVITYSVINDCM